MSSTDLHRNTIPILPSRRAFPHLPPLNDPYLFRTVFKPSIRSKGLTQIDTNAYLVFRGERFLEFAVSECLVEELYKRDLFDPTTLNFMHRLMSSTERLVKWTMKYGLDEDVVRDEAEVKEEFDTVMYVDLLKAYIGGLLAEGTHTESDLRNWVSGLVNYSFDSDFKLVEERLMRSFDMDLQEVRNSDHSTPSTISSVSGCVSTSSPNDECVKFSKDILYKILNPLRHIIQYKLLESKVPPHTQVPYFKIACVIDDKIVAIGEGPSKAKAGNMAANSFLTKVELNGEEDSTTVEATLKRFFMSNPPDYAS